MDDPISSQGDAEEGLSRHQPQPSPESGGIHIGDVGGSVNFSALGDIVGGDKITTITTTIQISVEAVTQRPLITASPYRGLDRFEDRDKDLFFGRDQLIKSLLVQLSASNVLLVLGASGSGKSSVVRAGLLPQLAQLIGARFRYFTLVPDVNPFESLRAALLAAGFSQTQTRELADAKPEAPAKLIHTLQRTGDQWLFFVDQFEEIFTVGDEKLRASFIAALVAITEDPGSSTKLVLAMRADFLDRFSPFPKFAKIVEKNIDIVANMHSDELRQAIEQPAARHGVVFEQGLVEEIIKDVQGQAGSLPLLQYTLDLLWQEEARSDGLSDRHLNARTYRELGGVRGALQKRADENYASFGDSIDAKTATPKQEIVRLIFLRLVDLAGEGSNDAAWRPVRRRALMTMFATAPEQEILRALINQKLLVSNREGEDATVEVAHEALFTSWGRLKNWIEAGKQVIFARNRLADDARRWQSRQQARDPDADDELLAGSRLSQALDMRARDDFNTVVGGLAKTEAQFLDASAALRDRRRQEEQERQQRELVQAQALATEQKQRADDQAKAAVRQRQLTWVMIALSLIFFGVAAFAWRAKRQATEAAEAITQRRSLDQYESALRAIAESDEGEVFARLSAALETWPGNQLAADRLFGLLTQRSFALALPGRGAAMTSALEIVSPPGGPVRLFERGSTGRLLEISSQTSPSGEESDEREIADSLGDLAQFSADGRLAIGVLGVLIRTQFQLAIFDLSAPKAAKWTTALQKEPIALAFFPEQQTVVIGWAGADATKSDGLHFALWDYHDGGEAVGAISAPPAELTLSVGALDRAQPIIKSLIAFPQDDEILVQFQTTSADRGRDHWLVRAKVDFKTHVLTRLADPSSVPVLGWGSEGLRSLAVSTSGRFLTGLAGHPDSHVFVAERTDSGDLRPIGAWQIPAEWDVRYDTGSRIQFWPGTNRFILSSKGRALLASVFDWKQIVPGPAWLVDAQAEVDLNQTIATWKNVTRGVSADVSAYGTYAIRLFDGRPGHAWPDIVLEQRVAPPAKAAPAAGEELLICASPQGAKVVAKPVDTGADSVIPNLEIIANDGRRDSIPIGARGIPYMEAVVGTFSKDGSRLAVVLEERENDPDGPKLIVWDTASHQPICNVINLRVRLPGDFRETIGQPKAIAFTELPDVVCVAGKRGGLLLWDWRRAQPFSDVLRPNSAKVDEDAAFTLQAGPGTIALTIESGDRVERRVYRTSFGQSSATVPNNIIELSKLIGGRFIDENSVIHDVETGEKSTAAKLRELKDQFARGNSNDPFVQFGRWFLADRASRAVSPTAKSTIPNLFETLVKIGAYDDAELLTLGDVAKLKRVDVARSNALAEEARKNEQQSTEKKGE